MKKPLPLLILVILFASVPIVKSDPDFETLWCNSYIDNRLGWSVTGISPYLDDTDGSYIYTKTASATEGDFGFVDLAFAGTITSVTIYIECYADDAPNDDGFDVYVYDGNSWTMEGSIQPSQTIWGTYETLTLTSKLDTDSKVNSAQVYFLMTKSGGADEVYIRRAYLYVDYTPSQQGQEYHRYPTQSISWSGSASKTLDAHRSSNQGITLSSDSSKTCNLKRTLTQSISFSSGALADIFKNFKRTLTMALQISSGASRKTTLSRNPSQSISLSSIADRYCSQLRGATQNIITNFEANRILSAIRTSTQSITITSGANRLLSATRTAVQSITISTVADKICNYARTAQQGISLTVDAIAQFFAAGGEAFYRTVTMALSFSSDSNRRVDSKRSVGQTIYVIPSTSIHYDEDDISPYGGVVIIQTEQQDEPAEKESSPYLMETALILIGTAVSYIYKRRRS